MASPCNNSPDEVIEKVVSAKANADKFDAFVNGTDTETVQLGAGDPTPTIRNAVRQVMADASWAKNHIADAPEGDVSLNNATALLTSQPRTLADRFADVLNTKDFGIVGDGATDDSSAISDLSSVENATILYNKGLYKSSSSFGVLVNKNTIVNTDIEGFSKKQKDRAAVFPIIRDAPSYPTYAMNGAACDGDNLFVIYIKDENNSEQYVQRISLETGLLELVATHTDLGHANSATCYGNHLYVCPGESSNDSIVYKINKTSLLTEDTFDISSIVGPVSGIAYDETREVFAVRSYDDGCIYIFNTDFQYKTKLNIDYNFSEKGLSAQDICFKDGYLYIYSYYINKMTGRFFVSFITKHGVTGGVLDSWCLDIYTEIENLSVYGDKFIVGTNTSIGSVYNFYTVDIDNNMPTQETNNFRVLNCDDTGYYPKQLALYVDKPSNSNYKFVGDGSKNNPFTSMSEAVKCAEFAQRGSFYSSVVFILRGDFSDEPLNIEGFFIGLHFSVYTDATAKLGPVKIQNCKYVQFWNDAVSIHLTGSADTALSVSNSSVLSTINIYNDRDTTQNTIGIQCDKISTFEIPNGFTITGFNLGFKAICSEIINRGGAKITYSNCTTEANISDSTYVAPFSPTNGQLVASFMGGDPVHFPKGVFRGIYINAYADKTYGSIECNELSNHYSGIQIQAKGVISGIDTIGSRLILRYPNSNTDASVFQLVASSKILSGHPDGTLTWQGQPIQTSSDERLKTSINDVPVEVLNAWGKVKWGQFKFLEAVKEKGDKARLHIGLIAQKVNEVFLNEGLDACGYGILCHETWNDEYIDETIEDSPAVYNENNELVSKAKTHVEHRLARKAGEEWQVRYEEALALECAYQRWRLEQIEARLNEISGNGTASSGVSSDNI